MPKAPLEDMVAQAAQRAAEAELLASLHSMGRGARDRKEMVDRLERGDPRGGRAPAAGPREPAMSDDPFAADDASTPLTPEERRDLMASYVTLRRELNEVEALNVAQGERWALARKRDALDEEFLTTLHKRMFGKTGMRAQVRWPRSILALRGAPLVEKQLGQRRPPEIDRGVDGLDLLVLQAQFDADHAPLVER